MAYVTLHEIKRHLNIETTYVDDDPILQDLIAVASTSIDLYCDGGLSGYTEQNIPITIKQATLLMSAHWYLNRQIVSFAKGEEIPYSFRFLVDNYKVLLNN
jgi:hypothetical protein